MEKIKVSIIVPIYNVQDYLIRCLDSLNNQTLKEIEIILVNDGSTDKSGIIADDYANHHNRFKMIHKKNGGLSSARNAGIDAARGEYIGFIDSDDYIENDMFEYLYKKAKKFSSDVAACGYTVVYPNGNFEKITKDLGDKQYTKEEAMNIHLFSGYFDDIACNKLYKKEIFQNLRFEVGKLYEDMLIMPKILDKCSVITLHSDSKYNYCKRNDSIGGSKFSPSTLSLIDACDQNVLYCTKIFPDLQDIYVSQILWDIVVCNKMILANAIDNDIFNHVKAIIRKEFKLVWKCRYINGVRKLQITLFLINKRLYSIIYKKYLIKNR